MINDHKMYFIYFIYLNVFVIKIMTYFIAVSKARLFEGFLQNYNICGCMVHNTAGTRVMAGQPN